MKFANPFLAAANAALLSSLILLPGCSGDQEDVHVTYCRELIETRVGSTLALQWKGSEQEIQRPDYAKITLSFEAKQEGGAATPMQAACFYKYATADENAMTHSTPLSAYATVPYRLTVNGRDVTVEVLHDAVKEAALQQGRAVLEHVRDGLDEAARRIDAALPK